MNKVQIHIGLLSRLRLIPASVCGSVHSEVVFGCTLPVCRNGGIHYIDQYVPQRSLD